MSCFQFPKFISSLFLTGFGPYTAYLTGFGPVYWLLRGVSSGANKFPFLLPYKVAPNPPTSGTLTLDWIGTLSPLRLVHAGPARFSWSPRFRSWSLSWSVPSEFCRRTDTLSRLHPDSLKPSSATAWRRRRGPLDVRLWPYKDMQYSLPSSRGRQNNTTHTTNKIYIFISI